MPPKSARDNHTPDWLKPVERDVKRAFQQLGKATSDMWDCNRTVHLASSRGRPQLAKDLESLARELRAEVQLLETLCRDAIPGKDEYRRLFRWYAEGVDVEAEDAGKRGSRG